MDWFVAAVFVVPGVLSTLCMLPGRRWSLLVFVIVGGAVLMFRRTEPLWTAGIIGLLAVGSLALGHDTAGYELAIALALYAVASSRPPAVTWAAFVVVVLGTSLAVLRWMTQVVNPASMVVSVESESNATSDRVATVVGVTMMSLLAIAIGTSVRGRRLHVNDLLDRANAIARDRDQQAQIAAAAERTRIAREMHDVVAHSLTVMVALADGAKASSVRDPALAAHALDELTETGRAALGDMRRILGVLRDPDGSDAPLEPTSAVELEDVVERFRTAGLPVRLVRTGPQPLPDAGLRQAVHRIVQESLTNVLRYARSTPLVVVEVVRRDETATGGHDWLDLRIVNQAGQTTGEPDGVGTDTRPLPRAISTVQSVGTGRGIIGMRERAAVYGGTVTAGPTGRGWEVHATLRLDMDRR